MDARLLILTSRQNYSWISMEEIISWIEQSWSAWAEKKNISFKIIDVDKVEFSQFIKSAITSEMIVVTCFNTQIAGYLKPLRDKLSIHTPWVYYLHGLASYGAWPLFNWKIGNYLTSRDVFIGSCQRDKKQFELVFENIHCEVIPFSSDYPKIIESKIPGQTKKFAFIGRISSQKNLHTLLLAFNLLNHTNWEMHFFGKEDNYGSPLMGFRDKDYLNSLKMLVEKFGLENKVHFHGFLPREKIQALMENEKWCFVSPSIHSDENFGMAAFRCLLNGHETILSDWGGHLDFSQHFSQSVKLVKVYESPFGPFIDPVELALSLSKNFQSTNTTPTPEIYTVPMIEKKYDGLWADRTNKVNEESVVTTELLQNILKQHDHFQSSGLSLDGTQVFYDYKDPLSQIFFEAYGQQSRDIAKGDNPDLLLVPWVSETQDAYLVHDPHRGHFSLDKGTCNLLNLQEYGWAYSI